MDEKAYFNLLVHGQESAKKVKAGQTPTRDETIDATAAYRLFLMGLNMQKECPETINQFMDAAGEKLRDVAKSLAKMDIFQEFLKEEGFH